MVKSSYVHVCRQNSLKDARKLKFMFTLCVDDEYQIGLQFAPSSVHVSQEHSTTQSLFKPSIDICT